MDGVYLRKVTTFLEAKGIQLAVPWVIVTLNVVITILNAMVERRKEANILSSIGVNPLQLGSIFVAEAMIIGLIGGGIGYLLGLNLYYIMGILEVTLDVNQKISAFWSLASIMLSMITVIAGSIIAMRFSVIMTPSLMRRWEINTKNDGIYTPVEIPIPVKIERINLKHFVKFFYNELYLRDHHETHKQLRIDYNERYVNIDFKLKSQTGIPLGATTINTLVIDQKSDPVKITLESRGDYDMIRETGSLVRQLVMRWSTP